jgi:nicotinamidase-related amidase
MTKEALLVIDVQTGIVGGDYPVYQAPVILQRVQKLIEDARDAGVPVVYVQHDEAPEYDGVIHPDIAPQANEPVIHKFKKNAFEDTNLKETLDAMGITKLVIAGCATNFCINASTIGAHELGYDVVLVEDSHSTNDSEDESAVEIIKRHNEKFAQFAKLVKADALQFE